MTSFWNFLFGTILIIIWIIAGGFITQANIYLTTYKDIDPDFHEAYWSTFWAAFITWFLIALFILLVILAIVGVVGLFGSGAGEVGLAAEEASAAEEEASIYEKSAKKSLKNGGSSWITVGFLCFAMILVGITGALATVGASSIANSKKYDPTIVKLKTAYTDCIIAAITCIGAAGLLLIGIIIYFIVGHQQKKKVEQQEEITRRNNSIKQDSLNTNSAIKQDSLNTKSSKENILENELQTLRKRLMLQGYNGSV